MPDPILDSAGTAFDLVLERVVDIPPALVWRAWTTPELVMKWFTPAPWKTTACEIDLRPGGRFYTMMQGPQGEAFPNTGCYLEIVEAQRLVWTSALAPGFRPVATPAGSFLFTAAILLAPEGSGTRYTAIGMHKDAADRDAHAAMGFEAGWGKALEQLVAAVKPLASG